MSDQVKQVELSTPTTITTPIAPHLGVNPNSTPVSTPNATPHYAFYRAIAMNQYLNTTERLVAIYLLTRMNGGKTWPSAALIQKELGLSRSTVLEATKQLRKQRLINAQQRGSTSNIYSLTEEFIASVDAAWHSGKFDEAMWIGFYKPPADQDADPVDAPSLRHAPPPPGPKTPPLGKTPGVRDVGLAPSEMSDPEDRDKKKEQDKGPRRGASGPTQPGSTGEPEPVQSTPSGVSSDIPSSLSESLSSLKENVGDFGSVPPAEKKAPEKPASRANKATDEDRALALFILGEIKKIDPNAKMGPKWAEDIRLMRERDGRTPEEIKAVFLWANEHEFWRANILSPSKLRQQFTQLLAQRRRPVPIQWPADEDEDGWKDLADLHGVKPGYTEEWPSFKQRIRAAVKAVRRNGSAQHVQ